MSGTATATAAATATATETEFVQASSTHVIVTQNLVKEDRLFLGTHRVIIKLLSY